MWLLTTTGRPKEAQRLLDACRETMTQPGVCFVDGGSYPDLDLPDNWMKVESENIGVGPAMNWFLKEYPEEPFYGWLADDFIPITPGWDAALSEAAGSHCLAYCHDGWRGQKGGKPGSRNNPNWLTSAFAVGGDLVRVVGWFSPPGLRQAGIDSAWNRIGRRFGLMRYLASVRVDHYHYKNGKRPRDETDNKPETERHLWIDYRRTYEVSVMTRVKNYIDMLPDERESA